MAEFSLVGGVAEKKDFFALRGDAVEWLRKQVIARHEEMASIIGGAS
jgi:hypothetical protein